MGKEHGRRLGDTMALTGLCEVILFVRDMDRMVRFYRDRLGLRVTYPGERASYEGEFWVTLETGACALALHGGGAGRIGEDSPKFVLESTDIAADREVLLARGVPMSEVRSPAPGIQVCDGADLEGNRFSIESRS